MEMTQDNTPIGTPARRERDRLQQLTGARSPGPARRLRRKTDRRVTAKTRLASSHARHGLVLHKMKSREGELSAGRNPGSPLPAPGTARPRRSLTARRRVKWRRSASSGSDNEMLEFLGDAVLGLVTSEALFHRFPEFQEGHLSKLRAHLVGQRHLLRVAEQLQIGHYMRLGRGEERSGGRNKASLLVDALEAILAALYLDGGWAVARDFIVRAIVEPELAHMNLETSAIPVWISNPPCRKRCRPKAERSRFTCW